MGMKIQPAVKKETGFVALTTAIGTLLMFLLFYAFHATGPESVPFDYKVILGGVCGTAVAVLNFFLMGIAVQKVTAADTDDLAYKTMKASYRFRTLAQILWVVIVLIVPCFNGAAGIIPLFFPNISIKIRGIWSLWKSAEKK